MKKNIFVIGDLVIDHTVFVMIPTGTFQAATGESVYRVIRRQDTAGGAANSARILAALNEGQTYLWGIIGSSTWGNFRSILDASQLLDNAQLNIEFRGVQDETDARMNTITRLIMVGEDGRMKRTIRFDDVDHVHVSDSKRETIMYHLRHVHDDRNPLDAIIINDFDKKCLTKELVKAIAEFAENNKIPLFVDPKRIRDKYTDIKGTAILPNLIEWCYLTEQSEKAYYYWRNNLDNPNVLLQMANCSFRYLRNFKYHIITCDRLGSVIIAPHPKQKHLYAVYRAQAEELHGQIIDSPLGSGDVLTAVFAAEYDKDKEESEDCTEMALAAFHRANIAVGCYCHMPWHRMPSLEMVKASLRANPTWTPSAIAEPSKGMLYLPEKVDMVLSDFETILPGVYSTSIKYHNLLKLLVDEITVQTQQITPKSFLLGAPSGSGKSRILEGLRTVLNQVGIPTLEIKKSVLIDIIKNAPEDLLERIKQSGLAQGAGMIRYFVIIDEAYGNHFVDKHTLDLVQWAHNEGIRFLFADSLFYSGNTQKVEIMPDIKTRCAHFNLPGIIDRPGDIPYLIANRLLELAESDNMRNIRIEGRVLLSVTDRILEEGHPRVSLHELSLVYDNAKRAKQSGQTILVLPEHLPARIGVPARSSVSSFPNIFTVSR